MDVYEKWNKTNMKILKTFIAGGQVKQLRPVVSIENGLLYNTWAKTQVEKDNSERFTKV